MPSFLIHTPPLQLFHSPLLTEISQLLNVPPCLLTFPVYYSHWPRPGPFSLPSLMDLCSVPNLLRNLHPTHFFPEGGGGMFLQNAGIHQ